jgi:hypothetical protein
MSGSSGVYTDRRKEPHYTSSTKMAERDFIEAIQVDIDEMAVSLVKLKQWEFQVRGAAPAHSSTCQVLLKCWKRAAFT